jgi:predicted CxxxxCH...CXXCH cytochrome family protein
MNQKIKNFGTLSLARELSKSEQKMIYGGTCLETYCDGNGSGGPFPTVGQWGRSSCIGCVPGYCTPAAHGSFLYCGQW